MIIARVHQTGKIHYGHCAKIIAGICDALAYAHSARGEDGEPLGLVYRDLSPETVLVSMEGIAKLLDFGMAPHQAAPKQLTHRMDVFRVGGILYELTTGIDPLRNRGDIPAEAPEHALRGRYRKPSEIVAGYPLEMERLVLSALDPDGANQRPSAQELSDRLEEFAASPEHRSGPRPLAAWLRELFPEVAPAPSRPVPVLAAAPPPDMAVTVAARPVRSERGVVPRAEQREDQLAARRAAGADRARTAHPFPDSPHHDRPLAGYARPPSSGGGFWKWAALAAVAFAVGSAAMALLRRAPPPRMAQVSPLPPSPRLSGLPPSPPRPAAPTRPIGSAGDPERSSLSSESLARQEVAPGASDPLSERSRRSERSRPIVRPGRPVRRHALLTKRPGPLQGPASHDPAPAQNPAASHEGPPSREAAPSESPPAPRPAEVPAPVPAPSPPRPAPPPTPTRPAPSAEAPPSIAERAARSGPAISATPKSPVPIPTLPRMVLNPQPEQLARVCQAVEATAVSLAGVSPEFARGVTGPLRRVVRRQVPVYPIAMYYFVVREAASKHDSATAAANLAAAQASGAIARYKDLPGIESNP
jgi:serine/threonine-protein kinase